MTTPEEAADESFALGLSWRDTDRPAEFANQFTASLGFPASDGKPEGVYLAIGHVQPPLLSGSDAELEQQLRNLGSLPVETLGRYFLSRERVRELIGVLERTVAAYDKLLGVEDSDTTGTDA